MKILDIALKDLLRSFRSAFALIFMFGVPLLVTGMFYLMFGNLGSADEGFSVPVTKVVIANLDQGSPDFAPAAAQMPEGSQANSLGELILKTLQAPDFAQLLEVSVAADAEAARAAVDRQEAGVAIIIPADFTARFTGSSVEQVSIELYSDPTLSLGPAIVQSVLKQFMDNLSGAKIAVQIAMQAGGNNDPQVVGQVLQLYMASQPQGKADAALLETRDPSAASQPVNPMLAILGPIMGGMMVFYAFYTGTTTAQTILREEEERTLPRLFTTPTPQAQILTGKFLAVFLTVMVQVITLLIAARFIFAIAWGSLSAVVLMAAGTILCASSFGIFVNSLLKSTKQGGIVYGGVLTVTGMLGMLPIFTGFAGGSQWADAISLIVPQGWAVRAIYQSIEQAPLGNVALTGAVLLAWSVAFFAIGVWRFQKRYA